MMKERMIGMAIAAAAAWGSGCSSSEDPQVRPPDGGKPSTAQVVPPAPPQAKDPQVKPPNAGEVSPAKLLPQGMPQAGTLHESWKGVPIGDASEKGLKWLVSVQGKDGGWGQDGGNEQDARQNVKLESGGNDLANTSLVCLALLRSGTSMSEGPYRDALRKGVEYVLQNIEAAAADGLSVTKREGTQIQRKLGPYIDTFLSTMLLSEIDGRMADEASQKRLRGSLAKCIAKIEKNQQKDGSWNQGGGWAPIISTSIASRSLYNAQQKGNSVDAACMKKVEEYTNSNYDAGRKSFRGDAGAGVELYVAAQSLEQSSRPEASGAYAVPAEVARAKVEVRDAATAKLSADSFVAGYGSMGGEEFVSYLNISDSLLRAGGKPWTDWNGKIKERLVKLQNQDGTWAGHHCITGRVACTASAVMTILAERTAPKS
jgi:hypothetical protein